MKNLTLATLVLFAALVSVPSQAATSTAQFPVNITLTPICQLTTLPAAMTFAYTSLQTTPVTATGTSVGITCTNTLPYSVSLTTGYNLIDAATSLAYTLTLNGAAADLLAQAGSGSAQSIAIGGTMAANQSGTCAATGSTCNNFSSTNRMQTLTITY